MRDLGIWFDRFISDEMMIRFRDEDDSSKSILSLFLRRDRRKQLSRSW